MKTQIVLPVSQVKESRVASWLNRKNVLFSLLLEETVTNKQTLLVLHVLLVFTLWVGSCFTSVWAAAFLAAWLGAAVRLMKKGGIK